jgi:hypothetical protein
MIAHIEEACINCHFLMKECDRLKLEVSRQNREAIRGQDYSWLQRSCSLACYRGIWDEGYKSDPAQRYEIIVKTRRMGTCFFWSYTPGMLFPTAKELQAQAPIKRQDVNFESQSLEICFENFGEYIGCEKRMTFWRFGANRNRKWISNPEQHAKNLLHTFLVGRFGDSIDVFEEINSGAGFIDLFIIMPRRRKIIVELKMCGLNYAQSRAQDGKEQLSHYMISKQAENGYLLVFDGRVRNHAEGFEKHATIQGVPITTLVVDVRPYVKQKDAPKEF